MDNEIDDGCPPCSITWYQAQALRELLPAGTLVEHLSRSDAAKLLSLHSPNARWRQLPPTELQVEYLSRNDLLRPGLTRGEASDIIAECKKKGL